jgi:hypothetical protein
MVDLETLAAELHRLAAKRDVFAELGVDDLSACSEMTALPRYRDGNAGRRRLLADLKEGIESVLEETDRPLARAHFRLEHGNLQYMARHRTIAADGTGETTKTRRRARTVIEPRLAFYLFQKGIEWEEPDTYLDYGFRALEHDWTLTVDPLDNRRETFRQVVKARCVRPGQRFYVFGANDDGASLESVRAVSDDPDHTLVGDDGVVRLDRSNAASDDYLVVVYLGKDYTTDDPLETGIERVTLAQTPPAGSGLFITPVGEMTSARLTVHAPRQMVRRMTLIRHNLGTPWKGAKPDEIIERTSDAPVVFPIPSPEIGYSYEIAWEYNS